MSRAASRSRCPGVASLRALARCAVSAARLRSCSCRHSARSRAATPIGVEILDLVHHRHDLVQIGLEFAGQRLLHLFERAAEVAVLVDGVDHRLGDRAILGGEQGHVHLPQQVFAQGGGRAVAGIDVGALVVAAGGAGGERVVGLGPVVAAVQFLAKRIVVDGSVAVDRQVLAGRGVGGVGGVRAAGVVGRRRHLVDGGGLEVVLGLALVLGLLEQGVAFERLLDLLLQLERRQLQQADRLLQLRRDCQVLTESEIE